MPDAMWEDDEVAATIAEVRLSAGVDANLPDEVRFVRGVRDVLKAAAGRHGSLALPAVFLFAPPDGNDLEASADYHPRIHTGELDPSGRIWFVGAAVRSGRSLAIEKSTTAEVFARCEELGFGESAAVFCDTGSSPAMFAWYPNGVCNPDDVIDGPLDEMAVPTIEDILEVVDRVHASRLMTSHNQGTDTKLWEKPSHHWAHERAERRVQDALMAGISGRFGRPFYVVQEQGGDSGRFDLGFREALEPGTSTLHAVVELKVARSFGSGGAPVSDTAVEEHVVSGIKQARTYSDEHGASDAACLVFDLRTLDKQLEPPAAAAKADELGVLLRYWLCFPTAEVFREYQLARAVD